MWATSECCDWYFLCWQSLIYSSAIHDTSLLSESLCDVFGSTPIHQFGTSAPPDTLFSLNTRFMQDFKKCWSDIQESLSGWFFKFLSSLIGKKSCWKCQQRWQSAAKCQKWARTHRITRTWFCMCLKRRTVFSLHQTFFLLLLLVRHFLNSVQFLSKRMLWADQTPSDKAHMLTNSCHCLWLHSLNSRELLAPGSRLFYSYCFGTYPRLKTLQVIRRPFK